MRIAIIGAGISGLGAAYVLQREHQVTVFEKSSQPGGHARTVDVGMKGRSHAVDTGFVVYNEATYPNFVRLLDKLGVDSQPTRMSFSVRCESSGLEYCGTSLNTLFAQRRNLLKPSFYRMLLDIVRFNRAGSRVARGGEDAGTVGEFLSGTALSDSFRQHYLVPLVAAIWSLAPGKVEDFPADFFLGFMSRHRLLQVGNQLPWRVIRGGSREYLNKLTGALRDGVRTEAAVRSVLRLDDSVEIRLDGEDPMYFDHVIIATHSDQALRLLDDPSDVECEVLGDIPYQTNDSTLHTDSSLLPRNRRARANWNYFVPREGRRAPVTTYDMTGLQGLNSEDRYCITLNDGDTIASDKIVTRQAYDHPVYSTGTIEAQKKRNRISGVRRTHYCGAYWGSGFHEDGLVSALDICRGFGLEL